MYSTCIIVVTFDQINTIHVHVHFFLKCMSTQMSLRRLAPQMFQHSTSYNVPSIHIHIYIYTGYYNVCTITAACTCIVNSLEMTSCVLLN